MGPETTQSFILHSDTSNRLNDIRLEKMNDKKKNEIELSMTVFDRISVQNRPYIRGYTGTDNGVTSPIFIEAAIRKSWKNDKEKSILAQWVDFLYFNVLRRRIL